MKRAALLLIITMVCSVCFGQIQKIELKKKELFGRVAPGGVVFVECYKYEDSSYLFRYKDEKYSKIDVRKNFSIKSNDDFNTLYSYLDKGFEDMPKEPEVLNIGDGYLILKFSRFMGGKVVRIAHSTALDDSGIMGYTIMITQKQINKLFGKQ